MRLPSVLIQGVQQKYCNIHLAIFTSMEPMDITKKFPPFRYSENVLRMFSTNKQNQKLNISLDEILLLILKVIMSVFNLNCDFWVFQYRGVIQMFGFISCVGDMAL